MNQEPKLKRPEDVDAIYAALQREKLYLWSVLNEIRPYLLKGDIDLHYGGVTQTEEAFNNHIFDFLWLILCIEGYES